MEHFRLIFNTILFLSCNDTIMKYYCNFIFNNKCKTLPILKEGNFA